MTGRPRKLVAVSTGKIGKDKIESRKEQESKLKLDKSHLNAPKWLSKAAKEEFSRVVSESEKIGFIDNLDLSTLAIYANAYDSYVKITKELRKRGFSYENANGNITMNPLVNAQEKYAKQIFQCSSKLGLATTDRLKLIVPTKEEEPENKFAKYIKTL